MLELVCLLRDKDSCKNLSVVAKQAPAVYYLGHSAYLVLKTSLPVSLTISQLSELGLE